MTNPDNVGGLPESVEYALKMLVNYATLTGMALTSEKAGEFSRTIRRELCRAAPAGGDSAPAGSGEVLTVERVWLADIAWIADNIANMTPVVAFESLRKIREKIDARLAQDDATLLRKLQQGADYVMVTELPERDVIGVHCDGHSDEQMKAYGEECAAGVSQFMQGQRRDARRYRWLREAGNAHVSLIPRGTWFPDPSNLDAAIDEAIAASQGQEGGE